MFRAGLLIIVRKYSLYIQQLVYVTRLCLLDVGRIGMELLPMAVFTG